MTKISGWQYSVNRYEKQLLRRSRSGCNPCWTPSQVRTLMYLHELVRAQRGEIEKSKDQLQRLETLIGQHGPEETSAKIHRSPKLREEFPQLATASRPETSPEHQLRPSGGFPVTP